MKKLARKSAMLDKVHRGLVLACIGITIYGTAHLGMRWYRYFTVLRPEQKRRELLEKQELLAEGSSESLRDTAQDLKT